MTKIARGKFVIETLSCAGSPITAELPSLDEGVVFSWGMLSNYEGRVAVAIKFLQQESRDTTASLNSYFCSYKIPDLLADAKNLREITRNGSAHENHNWPYVVEQLAAEGLFDV